MGEASKLEEFSTADFSHLKGATNYANLELKQAQAAEFVKLLEPIRLDVGPELPSNGIYRPPKNFWRLLQTN
jgi:hypothetical protein